MTKTYVWFCKNCRKAISYKELFANNGECPHCKSRDMISIPIDIVEIEYYE